MLDINSYWLYHLQISSHLVGCVFILSTLSFAMQKLLSLIRSHVFIFVFTSFGRQIQKNIAAVYVKEGIA